MRSPSMAVAEEGSDGCSAEDETPSLVADATSDMAITTPFCHRQSRPEWRRSASMFITGQLNGYLLQDGREDGVADHAATLAVWWHGGDHALHYRSLGSAVTRRPLLRIRNCSRVHAWAWQERPCLLSSRTRWPAT